LDVGGGTGSLLRYFLDREKLFALDISEDCVTQLRARFQQHHNLSVLLGDITHPDIQSIFLNAKVDTILCTNVLEHVADDRAMLKAFHSILKPQGGHLALLVPAFQSIYGTMDKLAGHYRRYTRQSVFTKLTEQGFQLTSIQYMNSLAVLGWWLNGSVLKTNSLADTSMNLQIIAYDRCCIPVLRAIESLMAPPFGLSVIALAKAV
jgi:2-polyprenyl-3-methyl-5-hydroxy-6-metoxy-1,4-benzoquinol methylase